MIYTSENKDERTKIKNNRIKLKHKIFILIGMALMSTRKLLEKTIFLDQLINLLLLRATGLLSYCVAITGLLERFDKSSRAESHAGG